ncbi:MAG: hypothetical protein JO063_13080 [Pseudonocardiales bacterium]|nr:hypothetical protein [Pseudonocardiales bacterium]MBV9032701.1 hypothetical protein [Pseudonocardiales bacterium]MBW0011025.1 hypothetical protein [Pseudonocardiales bacterium]
MARWSEFVAAEPELARQVRACFAVNTSETLATLRRDGSPRISGATAMFLDGDLFIDMFFSGVKAADLRRDPRLALHSPTVTALSDDASDWPGEAKIAGCGAEETVIDPRGVPRSYEIEDLEGPFHDPGCPSGGLGDVSSSDQVDRAHSEVA